MEKLRAIIVDDEQGGRDSLRRLLEENCHDVLVIDQAGSVDQAVEVIRLHNPDLVFLDVEMPRGSGFELLKRMKNVIIFNRTEFNGRIILIHECDILGIFLLADDNNLFVAGRKIPNSSIQPKHIP